MSSSSPQVKSAQPKDAQDPSGGAKDPKVETSAPAASAAPVSLSEKPPLPSSDSTPAPATTTTTSPDPEKRQDSTTVPTTTADDVPDEPSSRVPDPQDRLRIARRKRLLRVHTRLARFVTWILLLGFVILPSTLTRGDAGKSPPSSKRSFKSEALGHFANYGLFAIGYACCLFNGLGVCCLWYIRKNETEWLFTNLFSAGLINAFSGLISTFVNVYGVQDGNIGASTKSTFTLTSVCTVVYAVLTAVFFRKRLIARKRRGSRASSAMV